MSCSTKPRLSSVSRMRCTVEAEKPDAPGELGQGQAVLLRQDLEQRQPPVERLDRSAGKRRLQSSAVAREPFRCSTGFMRMASPSLWKPQESTTGEIWQFKME